MDTIALIFPLAMFCNGCAHLMKWSEQQGPNDWENMGWFVGGAAWIVGSVFASAIVTGVQ